MNRRTLLRGIAATLALSMPTKAVASGASPSGKVIFALGMIPSANYRFVYLSLRMRNGEHRDDFSYHRDDTIFSSDRDFDDQSENGIVKILDLAAGEWGIVSYSAYAGVTQFNPTDDIFIPFTVLPGQTVYVGDYEMMTKVGKNWLGMMLEYDPTFTVTDKSQRDIPIAKRKDPSIVNVTVAIPTIATSNPYFSLNKTVGAAP
jgi:hypothetical protein